MHVGNPRLYTHFPPGHVDKKTSFIVEKIAKRIPIREEMHNKNLINLDSVIFLWISLKETLVIVI